MSFRRVYVWKYFACFCLSLNIFSIFYCFYVFESNYYQINKNGDQIIISNQKSQSNRNHNQQCLSHLLTIIIIDFENVHNDLENTIRSACKLINTLHIIIFTNRLYPSLNQAFKHQFNCNLDIIETEQQPLKSVLDSRLEYHIKTKYSFIIPDFTIIKSLSGLRDLINEKSDHVHVFPLTRHYHCFNLDVDLRNWTLKYTQEEEQSQCSDYVQESSAFLMKTSIFLKLSKPFTKPFKESLFLEGKLKKFQFKIVENDNFSSSQDVVDKNTFNKARLYRDLQLNQLYKYLGIKKVIKPDGSVDWHGCSKESQRCFGTVFNDMPEYLFKGQWTPPCCLENLRKTANYVFKILEQHKIRYWLEGGSLLGARRDGDIIPWDYDVDIGMYKEDVSKLPILQYIQTKGPIEDDEGFVWEKAVEGDFFRVQFSRTNRLHIDIFPFYAKDGTMTKDTWFASHKQDTEFPEKYLIPLTKIQFIGSNVSAPNNVDEFLELKFGKGVIDNPQYPQPLLISFP